MSPLTGRTTLLKLLLILMLLLSPLATLAIPAHADDKGPNAPDQPQVIVLNQVTTPNGVNTTVQISASQSTFIASGQPNANYAPPSSFQNQLWVGYSSPTLQAVRMLIQYNLGSIPSNATINSATAYIYATGFSPNGDSSMGFQAQLAVSAWNQSSATWNNANFIGGSNLPIGNFPATIGWLAFDSTNLVRTWVSGAEPNNGLIITGDESPSSNRSRTYSSSRTGNSPYIIVNYTTQCDTLPPVVTVNALPAFSPNQFTVSWSGYDQAPAGCPASGIASYDVWYQLNGGSFVRWLSSTTATSATFNAADVGAANGTITGFRARGVDNAGNSQSVGDAQAATTVVSSPPTVVVAPLPQYSPNAFWVTWSDTSNDQAGIATYDVQYRVTPYGGSAGSWLPLVTGTSGTSYYFTGGVTGNTYEFQARGTDSVGNVQPWGNAPQASTIVFANTFALVKAFNPPLLQSTAPVTKSFTVSWQGYAPPGANITGYTVLYSFNNGTYTLWNTFSASQTSAPFDWFNLGLGDGLYQFKATAASTPSYPPLSQTLAQPIVVDMAGKYHTVAHLPIVTRNSNW